MDLATGVALSCHFSTDAQEIQNKAAIANGSPMASYHGKNITNPARQSAIRVVPSSNNKPSITTVPFLCRSIRSFVTSGLKMGGALLVNASAKLPAVPSIVTQMVIGMGTLWTQFGSAQAGTDCGHYMLDCDGACFYSEEYTPQYHCDGAPDCYDDSDEMNCTEARCEALGRFICEGAKDCIRSDFQCNGFENCDDGSDEWNCTQAKCEALGRFVCEGTKKCIYSHYQCDGFVGCDDNSDEWNCHRLSQNSTKVLAIGGSIVFAGTCLYLMYRYAKLDRQHEASYHVVPAEGTPRVRNDDVVVLVERDPPPAYEDPPPAYEDPPPAYDDVVRPEDRQPSPTYDNLGSLTPSADDDAEQMVAEDSV